MSGATAYRSSPTRHRTQAEMAEIRWAIYSVAASSRPATVRQIFYRLVSQGVIRKTQTEYKHTVCRLLAEMRRDYQIPFSWIADNTRWMRKPKTYSGLRKVLTTTARTYRRALWEHQDTYVEIWCEKEAVAGVIYDVTDPWDVPLMVTRGYPSLTYLHSAAEVIGLEGRPCFLYYLGDLDPSGLDIARVVEEQLRDIAPDADISFERLAVTPEQVARLGLPTRPTKTSDSRSRNFRGTSVEVDAIPPPLLREMVAAAIEQHIDAEEWRRLKAVEREEPAALAEFVGRWAS
jgi:hypothetical protein